jgi:hypothetical protein
MKKVKKSRKKSKSQKSQKVTKKVKKSKKSQKVIEKNQKVKIKVRNAHVCTYSKMLTYMYTTHVRQRARSRILRRAPLPARQSDI